MATQPTTEHIVFDERGIAWIDDTNVKVIEVVADKLAHGSTPEEMHLQYPHLSLAQIHAALAYYYDHTSELDAQLANNHVEVARLRDANPPSPGRAKLQRRGKLP